MLTVCYLPESMHMDLAAHLPDESHFTHTNKHIDQSPTGHLLCVSGTRFIQGRNIKTMRQLARPKVYI